MSKFKKPHRRPSSSSVIVTWLRKQADCISQTVLSFVHFMGGQLLKRCQVLMALRRSVLFFLGVIPFSGYWRRTSALNYWQFIKRGISLLVQDQHKCSDGRRAHDFMNRFRPHHFVPLKRPWSLHSCFLTLYLATGKLSWPMQWETHTAITRGPQWNAISVTATVQSRQFWANV